jgi:hypothetical protein
MRWLRDFGACVGDAWFFFKQRMRYRSSMRGVKTRIDSTF